MCCLGKCTTKMEMVPLEKLVPYVNNARTHSPEQVNKLRSSLREFGFVNPVIIDKDYSIIAGHGRVMAAREENMDAVPCVLVDYLTDAQKKAYILADNRLAMDAGWDEELLRMEIEALQGEEFDISLTGFDEKELSDLFGTDDGAGQEDGFDVEEELQKPCFSKSGDLWHLGRHTVICGDSTLTETYQRLLAGAQVNLVCTKPAINLALRIFDVIIAAIAMKHVTRAALAIDGVRPFAARYSVIAGPGIDRVIAAIAIDRVMAGTAVDLVIAGKAGDRIFADASEQRVQAPVVACAAGHDRRGSRSRSGGLGAVLILTLDHRRLQLLGGDQQDATGIKDLRRLMLQVLPPLLHRVEGGIEVGEGFGFRRRAGGTPAQMDGALGGHGVTPRVRVGAMPVRAGGRST